MKLTELPKPEIYRTGIETTNRTKFKFGVSAKSFKIMSSLIYKYKIRAIIREVSCNAIDGHIAAGIFRDFDVHIPSVLEPWFFVRDYGISLGDEQVDDIFTTYFASTKTESNEFIGALGLGSKSPFCYADTFTVETYLDGVKTIYSAYMENGEPFITAISKVESDEPRGVKIIVPVKEEDIGEWEYEARRVYEPFTGMRPNFVGGIDLAINYQPKQTEDRDGIIRYSTKLYSGLYARMGNIMYPVDKSLYADTLFQFYFSESKTYIMDFALGDLDFMPSREELSMDKVTVKMIRDRLDNLNTGYHHALLTEFNKKRTVREKLVYYFSLPHSIQGYLNKNDAFLIDGEKLSMYATIIQEDRSSTFEDLEGAWANKFGDSKKCEYRHMGQRRRFKSETQKRIGLNKLIDPRTQKKLYIVDIDEVKFRNSLVGRCLLDEVNTIYFVNQPTTERGKARIADLIEFGCYDESEIVYLKCSEMIEEQQKYEIANPRSLREAAEREKREARPKTATCYHYCYDKKGKFQKLDLFLTKAEFKALPSMYGLKLYGKEDYSKIGDGYRAFDFDNKFTYDSDVKVLMEILNIKDLLVVRNSLWSCLPVSKIECVDEYATKLFMKAFKALKPNNYSCWKGKEDKIEEMAKLGHGLDKLVKNRYTHENYSLVKYLCRRMATRNIGVSEYVAGIYDPVLRKMNEEFNDNCESMIKRADEAYLKFKELNPLLDMVLKVMDSGSYAGRYFTDAENVKSDFEKLIRWK